MKTRKSDKFGQIRMELNSAIDSLEDVFCDYEEISEPMKKLNKVVDFLYKCEQEELKKERKTK